MRSRHLALLALVTVLAVPVFAASGLIPSEGALRSRFRHRLRATRAGREEVALGRWTNPHDDTTWWVATAVWQRERHRCLFRLYRRDTEFIRGGTVEVRYLGEKEEDGSYLLMGYFYFVDGRPAGEVRRHGMGMLWIHLEARAGEFYEALLDVFW